MQIEGCHAVVTGGARRIGRALTNALLSKGAMVSVTYRKGGTDVEDLRKHPKVNLVSLDLNDLGSIRSAAQEILKIKPAPTLLIHCASEFFPRSMDKVTENDWEKLHGSNFRGPFFLTQSLLAGFKEGVILNLVDIYADKPLIQFSAYVSQKAGLRMLTKNWALELAPNIRVNSISPGPVLFPEHFTEEQKRRHLEGTLLGREGSPKDIVQAAFFLIENDYTTGIDLKVDGGTSLKGDGGLFHQG